MVKPRRMSVKDRIGERYGRLVVVARAENKIERSGAVRAHWECRCDCGQIRITSGQSLSRGSTQSCGCLAKERVSAAATTHGQTRLEGSVYRAWNAMVQRCTNSNNTAWSSYGGRGITVCDRWQTFENFYADMGDRPDGMTLERSDNNKGYEPGNVYWASRLTQGNNRRTNVYLTLSGETKTIAEWGRSTGLGKAVIGRRVKLGWPVWKALTTPIQDTGKRRRKLIPK